MDDFTSSSEFLRGQAGALLARLPHAARAAARHSEVAALAEPFRPRRHAGLRGPELPARRFYLVAVTDWSLLLLPLGAGRGGRPAAALEIPLLRVSHVSAERQNGGGPLADPRGGGARSTVITALPQSPEVGDGGDGGAVAEAAREAQWAAALGGLGGDGLPKWRGRERSGGGGDADDSGGGGGGDGGDYSTHDPFGALDEAEGALTWAEGDALRLLTVERDSGLPFQLRAAWVGAHERAALARAAAPGQPVWAAPPPAAPPPTAAGGGLLARALQRRAAPQAEGATLPAGGGVWGGGGGGQEAEGSPAELAAGDVFRFFGVAGELPRPEAAAAAAWAAAGAAVARRQRSESHLGGQDAREPRRGLLSLLQFKASPRGGPRPPGGLRLQAAAPRGVYMRVTVSEAREAFRGHAAWLLRPASLLGGGDASALEGLILELAFAKAEKVPELRRQAFSSPEVLTFAAARLHAWGAAAALLPAAAAAAPRAEGGADGRGRARRRRVLRRLGLLGSSPVDLSAAIQGAADAVHCLGGTTAAGAGAPCSDAAGGGWEMPAPPGTRGGTYHADPLWLTPLEGLRSNYHFLAKAQPPHARAGAAAGARRGGGGGGWESDGGGSESDGSSSDGCGGGGGRSSGGRLLWERLACGLLAAAAARKIQLLISWLQMQLTYSEGCPDRLRWLSDAPLAASRSTGGADGGGGGGAPFEWTYGATTRQLLASLVTLSLLPGGRAAAGGCSSGGGGGRVAAAPQPAPAGIDDMLWWCRAAPGGGGASGGAPLLDGVVCCLGGLLALAVHARGAGMAREAAALEGVLREVPPAALHALLRAAFLRLLRLLAGDAGGAPLGAAAVLACRYGAALVAVLEAARGAGEALFDGCATEIEHLLPTPQVCKLMVAAGARAVAGGASGALEALNRRQLTRVLALVACAASTWERHAAALVPAAALAGRCMVALQT
ncbi:MAG: hypothetical protein J3K34DRAFT_500886 [Monoraphidium minutum]|nr:MAG: hypothetical protein J3K34DRAFT_500886 [Monoraphidium minutum]